MTAKQLKQAKFGPPYSQHVLFAAFLAGFWLVFSSRPSAGGVAMPMFLSPLMVLAYLAINTRVTVSEEGISVRSLLHPWVRSSNDEVSWKDVQAIDLSAGPVRRIHLKVEGKSRDLYFQDGMIRGFDELRELISSRVDVKSGD